MSSSNKFSLGLNNWTDNDKPMRLDFVSDNQILNDDAIWKADYDQNGDIANNSKRLRNIQVQDSAGNPGSTGWLRLGGSHAQYL